MKAKQAVAVKDATPAITVKPPVGAAKKLEYKIESDKVIPFTVDAAREILSLNTFQGERLVSERHLQQLYNAQCSGRFMWDQVCIALADCEGKTYRLNGQHTCWLRVNMNSAPDPQVRLIHYKVKNEASLRGLYCTFDQNKSRTYGHNLKASLVGTKVAADIWPSKVGEIASAFRMWQCDVESKALLTSSADVVEMISGEYSGLFKQVGAFYMQSVYDVYHRARVKACVAAMFAMFAVAPRKAHDFWEPICEQVGFSGKEDPRLALRKWLDTHSQSRKLGMTTVTEEEMYRACVVAWNKWRQGEKIAKIHIPDKRPKAK